MKKIITFLVVFFTFSFLSAQISNDDVFIPGTICKDPDCSDVDQIHLKTNPNQTQNGNGSIATSYTVSGCGLGFVSTSVRLNQRAFGFTPATGATQPASIAVSGLPACFTQTTVTKAFLYCGGSGNGIAISANITNTAGVTQTFPMSIIGTHFDKCWGYAGTYNYRADVSSIINGNGTYTLSGLPAASVTSGNDMDGATLFIIYRDPVQTYSGHFVIADGCIEGSGTGTWNISGFNVCGATNSQTNFAIVSDLQRIANVPLKMNSAVNNFTLPIANQIVWNYMTAGVAAATSGQTSATFGITTGGDCWNFAVAGMYYRTSCLACTSVPCVILPIELIKFEANCYNKEVIINWETSTEKNNDFFTLLRSEDGIDYKTITTLKGSGDSKSTKQYTYHDNTTELGKTYYYKLKQTDYNRTENYVGSTVFAVCESKNNTLDISPNPSSNEVYLLSKNDINNANITILNSYGQKVKVINNVNLIKNERFIINVSDITNGCYQLIISGNNETFIQKKIITYK